MIPANSGEVSLDERLSGPSILVLGMHRSGTSALTGALGLCGAWVGEEPELTGANTENPRGFWERRDVRQVCDRLLQTAGADWWKVTNFDPEGIPHDVLTEERVRFAKVISSLDERGTWVLKEPRLCLLLPALRELFSNCVCLHIVRNPLEVARSLKVRSGFSISGGLALWETYNRRAIDGSRNLPRVLVFHESLMLHPMETLDRIIGRLGELEVTGLKMPDEERLEQFISPSLYRNRATEKETFEYLSPSQRAVWRQICEDQAGDHLGGVPISPVSRQSLLDLESTEHSLNHHRARARELRDALSEHHRSVVVLQRESYRLNAALRGREAAIAARDAEIRERDAEIRARDAEIRERDARIRGLLMSTSWKVTAPLRTASTKCRWLLRNIRRVFLLMFWICTGQFPRAVRAAYPYYERYAPFAVDRLIPKWFREYAKLALSVSSTDETNESDKVSLSGTRRLVKAAEKSFWNGDLSGTLSQWRDLHSRFANDEAISGHAKLMISVASRLSDLDRYRDRVEWYAKARESRAREKNRVVIFSAITNGYDSLKLPEHLDPDFDYVLFTDSPAPDTGTWEIRPIVSFHSDRTRAARFVKTHPHTLFQGYDVAVWIDSNIMILGDLKPLIRDVLASDVALGAIPHPSRESIYDEVVSCSNRGKDEISVMEEQIEKYRSESFSHSDLIESNFLVFNLRHDKIKGLLDAWWREIDLHSRRDQLSLNYALFRTGAGWHRMTERPNSIRNHQEFAFVPHDQGAGPSVRLVEAVQTGTVDPYAGPSYAKVREERIRGQAAREVDIVVCVHDALDDVRRCLESVERTRRESRHRLIIVDDGSEKPTAEYLRRFAGAAVNCELLRNDEAHGYPKAANRGLYSSNGELVILLNSDTIVTDDWVGKICDAVFSAPGAGIVGPLSNAASYQSIPGILGTDGQTAVNVLPPGLTPDEMNRWCERWTTEGILPLVPLIHGFCLGVTREVIDTIGYLDDRSFPRGYGEENDYCFRATEAGFSLVVAVHTYIFHAKSKSYTEQERVSLMKTASRTFRKKYGYTRIRRAQDSMADNPILTEFRKRAEEVFGSGGNERAGEADSSQGGHMSAEDLRDFDFLDFGTGNGGCIDFARYCLGGRRGLGVEKKREAAERLRDSGYECIHGDVTSLEVPRDEVRFVTMSHFLEHLPDMSAVRSAVRSGATVASDFLFIQGPWFDADEYLKDLGLKLYWSDWRGHPCHLTTLQLREILQDLGLVDHVFLSGAPIRNSRDPAVHPLNSPPEQHDYVRGIHPEKPSVTFDVDVYREFACFVRLRPLDNWDRLLRARRKWRVLQNS